MYQMLSPNIITALRLIAALALPICCALNAWSLALCVFISALFTDYIDGLYARLTQQTSPFGAFFDAFTDKVLTTTCLTILMYEQIITQWHIIPTLLILWREIFVASIRHLPTHTKTTPFLNRLKTFVQMLACSALLATHLSTTFYTIGIILLWSASLLSVVSARMYWHKLKFFINK